MAEPISQDTLDFDQPINTDPDYSVTHIFSTDDITATFDGDTQGDAGANFVDFTATPKVTKEGISLYQRWSRKFGPAVKMDCMMKVTIRNDKTKEPFARIQSPCCA